MSEQKKTLWQKLRVKYRVVVQNEETLGETRHVRLSLWNLLLAFILMTLVTLLVFAAFVWYTPLKNYLPGFNEGMREQLVLENERVDSLLTVLETQDAFLQSFKSVVAGELQPDSVRSLDSLYIIRKEELLAAKSQIVEDFMADYEASVSDNLTLFDQAVSNDQLQIIGSPTAGGAVIAMLRGVVVASYYTINDRWVVVLQHKDNYLSTYTGIKKMMVKVGDDVKVGAVLGIQDEEKTPVATLWQNGRQLSL